MEKTVQEKNKATVLAAFGVMGLRCGRWGPALGGLDL